MEMTKEEVQMQSVVSGHPHHCPVYRWRPGRSDPRTAGLRWCFLHRVGNTEVARSCDGAAEFPLPMLA